MSMNFELDKILSLFSLTLHAGDKPKSHGEKEQEIWGYREGRLKKGTKLRML